MFGRLGRYSKAFQAAHLKPPPVKGTRHPPGTLNLIHLPGTRGQDFLLRRSRRLGPVFKMWLHGNHTTCIVGHAMGRRFLAENEGKVPLSTINLKPDVPLGSIRSMEGTDHRAYRKLMLEALQATPIDSHREEISSDMDRLLGEAAAASGGKVLYLKDFTPILKEISRNAMLLMFLGVSPRHPLYREFCVQYDVLAEGSRAKIKPPQHAAFKSIRRLIDQLLQDHRNGPALPACLLRYLADQGRVDDTAIGNVIHFVEPSQFDTHCLWRWVVNYISVDAVFSRLTETARSDPARFDAVSESAVLETFRLNQAELLLRDISEDIVFDGYFVPKGSKLRICVWEGHKDPALFDNPFGFVLDRFAEKSFGLSEYSPFGLDKHRCVGSGWVIDLSALFVRTLVRRFTLAQVSNSQPTLGKYHWQPGSRLGIVLRRRTPAIESSR